MTRGSLAGCSGPGWRTRRRPVNRPEAARTGELVEQRRPPVAVDEDRHAAAHGGLADVVPRVGARAGAGVRVDAVRAAPAVLTGVRGAVVDLRAAGRAGAGIAGRARAAAEATRAVRAGRQLSQPPLLWRTR